MGKVIGIADARNTTTTTPWTVTGMDITMVCASLEKAKQAFYDTEDDIASKGLHIVTAQLYRRGRDEWHVNIRASGDANDDDDE